MTSTDAEHAKLTQRHMAAVSRALGMPLLGAGETPKQALRSKLMEMAGENHQRASLVAHALDQAHAALDLLAANGHQFHLADGPGEGPSPQEWPKMLYDSSGNGTVFESEPTSGGPWYEHPTDRPEPAAAAGKASPSGKGK